MKSFEGSFPEKKTPKFETDNNGFVVFGNVAREVLNQQAQYASRYINGSKGEYPNLGEGLRFEGDPEDYHDVKIHNEDVEEFVKRVKEYKKSTGNPFA